MLKIDHPLPIIGVVHLAALPGSPRSPKTVAQVLDQARSDALIYRRAGVDALLVENHGDAPFDKDRALPHVPAILAVVARELGAECRCPVGVNVLRNDVGAALGAAVAGGASFVRADVLAGVSAADQGLIEGRAAEWLRYRRALGVAVEIWADVDVKFATPLYAPDLAVAARSLAARAGADRLLVTGAATGIAPKAYDLRAVKRGAPSTPVLVASGLDVGNVEELLPLSDGAIVGSAFKEDGIAENAVEPRRVSRLMNVVRAVRLGVGAPA